MLLRNDSITYKCICIHVMHVCTEMYALNIYIYVATYVCMHIATCCQCINGMSYSHQLRFLYIYYYAVCEYPIFVIHIYQYIRARIKRNTIKLIENIPPSI